jgi:hypothetical protein
LPILLPLKSLTINDVADVADFPDLHINLVSLGLLNPNPNLNLETGNLAYFALFCGNICFCLRFCRFLPSGGQFVTALCRAVSAFVTG